MIEKFVLKILRTWHSNWFITRVMPVRFPQRIVIVTGCYNSGTTLLYRMMRSHPALCGIPPHVEGDVLVREFKKAEAFGWRRMWHRCEDQVTRTGCKPELAKSVLKQWRWWIKPHKGYVEKSVCDILRIDFYRQSFTAVELPPQFLFIVRHPLPVIEGLLRRAAPMPAVAEQFEAGRYPPEMALEQWKASARITAEQMQQPDVHVIRYEDLCDKPEATLHSVFSGISVDASAARWFDGKVLVGGAAITVINNNHESAARFPAQKWQELLASDDELESLMSCFGYSPDISSVGA